MSIIRHPAACEVCSSKLKGAVEIALEREGDAYYLNVTQTAPMDWGICPRCKRVACFALCWNRARSYCKSCPSFDAMDDCPACKRELTGAVEIRQTEISGVPTILFEETSDRNWIQCDACSLVICKQCCRNPKSGFCNACLARLNRRERKETRPVVAEYQPYRFDSAHQFQTTVTKIQNNTEDK